MKLDFNDILIEAAVTTETNTRAIISPKYKDGNYPLFTAPMDTVIVPKNQMVFLRNGIRCVFPRQYVGVGFESHSLKSINELYMRGLLKSGGSYLIDVANGHMSDILRATKRLKIDYPDMTLMVGNVANPETYRLLSEAGADYIRIGIGNGGGCLTTQQTGVGYPMASLIKECYKVSCELKRPAKIVADGGMQDYSDVIKALALGADYVMLGGIFNKALESAGPNYLWKCIRVSQSIANVAYKCGIPVYKKFRGMSTKEVQKKWGVTNPKTSEGVVRFRRVEYTLNQWIHNFDHYLRSAMSYTGSKTLEDFIGKVKTNKISQNAYRRFNK